MAQRLEPGLNMASSPPSRRTRLGAVCCIGLLLVFAATVLTHASDRPGEYPAFLPIYATAAFLCELITAYLLSIQFTNSRQLSVGLIAAAYAFAAPVTVIQLCAFPGVFTQAGLFENASQTALWLWVIWHAAFPTWILAAMACEARFGTRTLSRPIYAWASRSLFLAPPVLGAAIGLVIIAHADRLPLLVVDGDYEHLEHSTIGMYALIGNLLALAAVIAIGRWRNVLNVWLTVAMLCSLLDVALTLAGGARFSLGFYASRLLSVATAALLLGITLWEINRLYARLSHSNRRLSDIATHDGLTGMRNRRHFDQFLRDEIAAAKKHRNGLALLICDVDFFKRFNDSFGHQHGDEVLISVARALDAGRRRGVDIVARYGGEEFGIVMPGIQLRGARVIAERLRQAVLALRIPAPPGGQPYLTISIGVASLQPEDDAASLIKRADDALYQAKKQGRNRVVAGQPSKGRKRLRPATA